jgi:hypothetical protein
MPTPKRAFTKKPKTKAEDYHGSCQIAWLPKQYTENAEVLPKSLNLAVTFQEALKLHMALQSCLQSINRYDRSTTEGRDMGVALSIKFESQQITVIEASDISAG